jgi:hypothetical protein
VALTAVELVLNDDDAQTGLGETAFSEGSDWATADNDDVKGCFGEGGGVIAPRVDIDASGRHFELTDKVDWKC